MGALDSFINQEDKNKTPLTKEQKESLIANELRNTNKVLNVMEGHLGIIALWAMFSMILTIIGIFLWIF